jgi:uncharacterized protein
MRVAVTGSTGLIGAALVRVLRADGHDVRRLVRRAPAAADESQWDPSRRAIDDHALDGVDAVVHLAGVGVADKRWSERQKRAILDSRVDGTTTIADAVARSSDHVRVLLSASAVGFYGDRGDEILDEADAAGTGFLADVVQQWEAATAAASDAGVRVAALRSGIVLSADGGALGKVLPMFKLGVGGKLGSGKQWMPWIALSDHLGAIRFLLNHEELSGPVNLVGPDPVRNRDYTAAIGRALHRPTLATVPGFALRVALAGFADEGPLVSQRVVPRKLLDAGYEFTYYDIDAALRAIL